MQLAKLPMILVFAVLGFAFATSTAHAYLDPGTASLVLQGIVGAIGAGIVAMGIYWRRFIGFFKPRSGEGRENGSNAQSIDEEAN